jgi:hypothetical protein
VVIKHIGVLDLALNAVHIITIPLPTNSVSMFTETQPAHVDTLLQIPSILKATNTLFFTPWLIVYAILNCRQKNLQEINQQSLKLDELMDILHKT